MNEDLEGLPDVDLKTVIDDIKNQQQDKDKPIDVDDLGQFKTPQDLLKSYKEIQGAFTRVSQENKSMKDQFAKLQEEAELARVSAQPINQANVDPDIIKFRTLQISDVLEEEAGKNRSEFQERYYYAKAVSEQYPQLATTPSGVRKLFELGDKLKMENLRKNANKALEAVFGEPLNDEEINKLRKLVKGDKAIKQTSNLSNAYMPDTSTSTKSGSDLTQKPNTEMEINESVKKGDVDGVIDAIFKGILAE